MTTTATNLTAELEPELRAAICDWISDCDQFEHEDEEDDARAGLIDGSLRRWVERRYDGGLRQFVLDAEPLPALPEHRDYNTYTA